MGFMLQNRKQKQKNKAKWWEVGSGRRGEEPVGPTLACEQVLSGFSSSPPHTSVDPPNKEYRVPTLGGKCCAMQCYAIAVNSRKLKTHVFSLYLTAFLNLNLEYYYDQKAEMLFNNQA